MDLNELIAKLLYTGIGMGIGWIIRDLKETADLWLTKAHRR